VPPTTSRGFLELVRKSGLTDAWGATAYVHDDPSDEDWARDPDDLADALVREGLLTEFQAGQLLQGNWRDLNLGEYRVLELLGEGGMGRVYLCLHTLLHRPVAVKVLPHNVLQDSAAVQRFYREARAVAALDHPNIVRAFDVDQQGQMHLLVMEYVD